MGGPDLKNGFKPNLKWSEEENNFKCCGNDRPHRTFDKIIEHAKDADNREA